MPPPSTREAFTAFRHVKAPSWRELARRSRDGRSIQQPFITTAQPPNAAGRRPRGSAGAGAARRSCRPCTPMPRRCRARPARPAPAEPPAPAGRGGACGQAGAASGWAVRAALRAGRKPVPAACGRSQAARRIMSSSQRAGLSASGTVRSQQPFLQRAPVRSPLLARRTRRQGHSPPPGGPPALLPAHGAPGRWCRRADALPPAARSLHRSWGGHNSAPRSQRPVPPRRWSPAGPPEGSRRQHPNR